jgi:hypothetical protein
MAVARSHRALTRRVPGVGGHREHQLQAGVELLVDAAGIGQHLADIEQVQRARRAVLPASLPTPPTWPINCRSVTMPGLQHEVSTT